MNKEEFFEELKELLEVEDNLTENYELQIDSLDLLSLIAFLDEKFGIQKNAEELKNISSVREIINLIGEEKLT